MSNEVLNAHIAYGEPCGPDAELSQIADWAGSKLLNGENKLDRTSFHFLRELGEYLHCENPNQEQRKYAIECYYKLSDRISEK